MHFWGVVIGTALGVAAGVGFSPDCSPSDFHTDHAFGGSAHDDLQKLNTSTAASCCGACSSTLGCTSWRWHSNTSKKFRLCTLRKGVVGILSKEPGIVSGASNAPPPAPSPSPSPMPPAPKGVKNVLWFIVDDLRPQFNKAYGQKIMRTPALDRLADTGLVFDRAYVQFAVCAPSRNSFMTGRRPDRTQAYNFQDDFRESGIGNNWTTLPQHFKNHGYLTLGGGKTFHPGLPANYDEPLSWSQDVPYFPLDEDKCDSKSSPTFRYSTDGDICTVTNSSSLFDYRVASKAIEWMHLAQARNRPFFLAVGIRRPHLKWIIPREYYELYAKEDVGLPRQPSLPRSIHNIAWSSEAFGAAKLNGSTYKNEGPWKQAVPDKVTQELRRGYYGAVSWIDSQIGRVLSELDQLGLTNDTIVAIHGDHGYQLGEKACWTKHTNFEMGTRVPLIIRAPSHSSTVGQHSKHAVELVDLYKTFAELAGISEPEASVQGKSLAPLFDAKSAEGVDSDTYVAYSQYDRCPKSSNLDNVTRFHGACKHFARNVLGFMGYSMRTSAWRYTVWLKWEGKTQRGLWEACDERHRGMLFSAGDAFCVRELYPHGSDEDMTDFEAFELENVVTDPKNQPDVQRLHAQLRAHFEGDQTLVV